MTWRRLAQARIEAALLAGEFDGLPGNGRPLDLSESEAIDPELRTAFQILKTAGMSPAWIELDRDLRGELETATRELRRSGRGEPARRRFRERVAEVNRMIDRLNLIVPALFLQRAHVDPERLAECILQPVDNEEPA